jgi:hypothetical protein
MPRTMISVTTPGERKPKVMPFSRSPAVLASAITNRSTGNAITISVRRLITVSVTPL